LEWQFKIGRKEELDMVLKLEGECDPFYFGMMVFEASIKIQPLFGALKET
jgi:hypothetical protein